MIVVESNTAITASMVSTRYRVMIFIFFAAMVSRAYHRVKTCDVFSLKDGSNPVFLSFARNRPAELVDIRLIGPCIFNYGTIEKDQDTIGIRQDFVEFRR